MLKYLRSIAWYGVVELGNGNGRRITFIPYTWYIIPMYLARIYTYKNYSTIYLIKIDRKTLIMGLKTLPLSLIFQILTIQFAVVTSQHEAVACYGNYTSNNTYASDLNTLLASLSSTMPENGFNNASVGGGANAMALCRSDIDPTTCSDCVTDLSEKIQQLCPDQFDAVMWSEFCMLRYSNQPIFGMLATFPARILVNPVNVSSPRDFGGARETLIGELQAEAAGGGALQKAAAGNMSAPDNQTIYGLVQCTPDLSADECTSCLGEAAGGIPGCCEIPQGITVDLPSCTLRYEIYEFYQTMLQPLVPQPVTGNCDDNRNRDTMIIVVSMVASVALACVGVFVGRKMKQQMKKGYPDHSEGVEISSVESIQYDFGTIRAATDDFSDANKLGQGGFGAVYKGKLEDGKKIAVKRLSKDSGQGNIEFKNEVLLLARLQHRNLVRLLGFSIQGVERLLVYEFVHNGSLDRFIFGGIKSLNLEWEKRYKIIGGVARGVLYLHQDSRHQIIHRDLKASNVLLDEEMNPKISDFGLAKLVEPDANQLCASRIVGTYGYMAPEYANRGHFSIKLDVYSFGVLVLEIVSGQRINEHDSGDLLAYAWRRWREGRGEDMIESVLMGNCSGARQEEEMLRCIHIGLLCVQQSPDERPTMAAVVMMLHSFSQSLPLPSEPGFYIHTSLTTAAISTS